MVLASYHAAADDGHARVVVDVGVEERTADERERGVGLKSGGKLGAWSFGRTVIGEL